MVRIISWHCYIRSHRGVHVIPLLLILRTVCSEHMGTASVPVSSIFEPVYRDITIEGQGPIRVKLPFSNVKYRVVVRVVDFSPDMLEDFAFARKPSEFGCLTDDEGDLSDDEADPADGSATWEWRFKLQLEDASTRAGPKPERLWASVDNATAECLTGCDASEYVFSPALSLEITTNAG